MDTEDDEIGYKKPPTQSQWKKGQSGNPSGKKKAQPAPVMTLLAWIAEKFWEEIETNQNGVPVKMPAAEAAASIYVRKFLQGSLKEQTEAMKILHQVGILEMLGLPMKPARTDSGKGLSEEDLQYLAKVKEMLSK